jgi:hypothetical protein
VTNLGVKIVHDELSAEAEKKALEHLGFTIISTTVVTNGQPLSPRPKDR